MCTHSVLPNRYENSNSSNSPPGTLERFCSKLISPRSAPGLRGNLESSNQTLETSRPRGVDKQAVILKDLTTLGDSDAETRHGGRR